MPCFQVFKSRKSEWSYLGIPEELKKKFGRQVTLFFCFQETSLLLGYYGAGHILFNVLTSFRCSLTQRKPIHHSLLVLWFITMAFLKNHGNYLFLSISHSDKVIQSYSVFAKNAPSSISSTSRTSTCLFLEPPCSSPERCCLKH